MDIAEYRVVPVHRYECNLWVVQRYTAGGFLSGPTWKEESTHATRDLAEQTIRHITQPCRMFTAKGDLMS